MTKRVLPALAAFWIAAAAAPVEAQEARGFVPREGYDEKTLGTVEVEITTREGPKTVRVSLVKLRIEGGQRNVAVALPAKGMALVQHRAGEAEVGLGGRPFAPLEGEWLRVPLPNELSVSTEDDSALMDLILVEE